MRGRIRRIVNGCAAQQLVAAHIEPIVAGGAPLNSDVGPLRPAERIVCDESGTTEPLYSLAASHLVGGVTVHPLYPATQARLGRSE